VLYICVKLEFMVDVDVERATIPEDVDDEREVIKLVCDVLIVVKEII